MTAGAPWSVKGIDPKAREVAKDLARRSGMTLGEWLNRVILEDDVPEEVFSEADFQARPQRLADAPPRVRLAAAMDRPDELSRVALALDRLADRIEASETRTGLAISGIEHSVRQAVARIETAERQTLAVAARVEEAIGAGPEAALREPAGPRSGAALRAIYGQASHAETEVAEDAAARLGDRLAGAEALTSQALNDLREALAALDARLRSVEDGGGFDIDRRLDALAAELGQRVEAARAEAVARLKASSAESIEGRLAEMSRHVQAAEQRSAEAIEQMGREVLSLAEALGRRLSSAEQSSARAVEQVGGEIARIGAVVESRLSRAEQAQADALEKLGAEIGRVTERLTERVAQSERRTAQAIDDVGEQVARVTERMENRHERLSNDLTERLRESDERTAKLLETARGGLDASVEAARGRLAEAAVEAAPETLRDTPPVHAFGPELFARAEAAPDDLEEAPAFGQPLAEDFAPLAEPQAVLPEEEDGEEGADPKPRTTREVIEQARLAARGEVTGAPGPSIFADRRQTGRPAERAPDRPGARRFGGLSFRGQARPPSTWQTALMLAGGAAFLSVGAAGVVLMQSPGEPTTVAQDVAAATQPAPRAAVALAQQPIGPTAPAVGEPVQTPEPIARPQPAQDYAAAVRDIESGQAGGLARLKAMADDGYAPAQFYLAKLYETGVSGVVKNPAEARKWTARAAEGGDRSAMHNLALYDFRGEGGPQDLAAAAKWFRKAAEAGVVDSQYNLGLLYESGSGVERDLAQAYKWFSIAAAGGDAQARANAVELEPKLTPAQLAALDKEAGGYHPKSEIGAQAQASGASKIASAQRVLGKLGYYRGQPNGAATPELKLAVQNFQRDHALPPTGALDPGTVTQLSVFTR